MWPGRLDSPSDVSLPFRSSGSGWSTLMSGVMPVPWIERPDGV